MAFTVVQVGPYLYTLNPDGVPSIRRPPPTGVSLRPTLVPRFERVTMGNQAYAVLVNTPTQPITIDSLGRTRVLCPQAPLAAPTLSVGGAGGLTGVYSAAYTYFITDAYDNLLAESGLSPIPQPITLNSQTLSVSVEPIPTSISGVRIYRTQANGSVYFLWKTVFSNDYVTITGDEPDSTLPTVAIAPLGTVPDLTLVKLWNGRLWGVSRSDPDTLRYSESGALYAWPAVNAIPIGRVGSDRAGITALVPRRNYLGVARRDQMLLISGYSNQTFQQTVLSEQAGCVSQESVIVYQDTAYWLWYDGVYRWDDTGLSSVSDGKVRTWFATDTVFNRAMFWQAFAGFDPQNVRYRLFLASAGSSTIDRWVEYDLRTGSWFGPHRTDALTPTSAFAAYKSDQKYHLMTGGADGVVYQDQEARRDGTVPITLDVITAPFTANEPDYEKYFGELSLHGPVLTTGSANASRIIPTVGELTGATAQPQLIWDHTKGRQRVGRLGVGKQATLEIINDALDDDVILYGVEINPITVVGRR